MDSAALLDLLGNENRRRILRLLARKPCYVTEISEYLGVSPKAVIDHLRKLEEAGLVESHTDDQRRKYFHIAQNLRLEVSVSPYGFGAKSAYPASRSLDMTTCRHLSIDVAYRDRDRDGKDGAEADGEVRGAGAGDDLGDVGGELRRLRELENELSLAQRWVQGRLVDLHERIADLVGDDGNSRLYAEILAAMDDGVVETERIAASVEVPPSVVREALSVLADRGVVSRVGEGWMLE